MKQRSTKQKLSPLLCALQFLCLEGLGLELGLDIGLALGLALGPGPVLVRKLLGLDRRPPLAS